MVSKKAGFRSIIECRTCKMWVDLEFCKGLTEMSQSEKNKLVFECWKCMVDERVKMADVNVKKEDEEEIKRLKAEVVSLKRGLEDERRRRWVTKLSQRFICWIRATHFLMEGRMD
ncbi:hypothetical protein FHG87_003965 [Trinorchestia longiramus]|nr:hypothetical protein FHG87_003965 [Trinorchestia longiramus]